MLSSNTGDPTQDAAPCFDEMLRTPRLFYLFLSFLVDQLASENLFFLQAVRLYRLLKRPQPEIDAFGRTIISVFCVPGAPSEVNICAETRKVLFHVLMCAPETPEASDAQADAPAAAAAAPSLFTPTVFDVAYGEIRGLLSQPFGTWLATGEWRDVRDSIRRKRPPSFAAVLRDPTLRGLFKAFLTDAQRACTAEELDSFQFCVEAESFRELVRQSQQAGTAPGSSSSSSSSSNSAAVLPSASEPLGRRKKAHAHKRSGSSVTASAAASAAASAEASGEHRCHSDDEETAHGAAGEGGKKKQERSQARSGSELEKMARAICKRHTLPKRSKQVSYRLFLSTQQDHAIAQWSRHALFVQWTQTRVWADVPYPDDTPLRQPHDATGAVACPSLAAVLVSLRDDPRESGDGVGPLFRLLLSYSSCPRDLDFLVAVLRFHQRFGTADAATTASKDDMASAALAIFNTYLVPVRLADAVPPSPCPQFLRNPFLAAGAPTSGTPSPAASPSTSTITSISSTGGSSHSSRSAGSSPDPAAEGPLVVLSDTLVNEVRSVLWSSARTKVHAEVFRRAGAFVYQRAQDTWFRELCASRCWADREYDTDTRDAAAVAAYLGDAAVVADVLRVAPRAVLYDDIVADPGLYTRFAAFQDAVRRPVLDALDPISAFRARAAHTPADAQGLRKTLKRAAKDNVVVRKLLRAVKEHLATLPRAADSHDTASIRISGAAFDFVRDALLRQLLAETAEAFLARRKASSLSSSVSSSVCERATDIRFFKYVEPMRTIEFALTTKNTSLLLSTSGPSPTTTTPSTSSSSSSGISMGESPGAPGRKPRTGGNLSVVVPRTGVDGSDGDDATPSPGARAKKAGLLGFLRKPRHAPLLRLRTPSTDAPAGRVALSDPASPVASQPQQQQQQQQPSPVSSSSSPRTGALTVPSLDEVLGSTYFRQLITDYYFGRVDEDEANAWDDLTAFYAKFAKLDDAALARAQHAAARAAHSVVDRNRAFLADHAAALEERLKGADAAADVAGTIAVTANFFRGVERALFAAAYDAFAHHLVQGGWKVVPTAIADDDDMMFI